MASKELAIQAAQAAADVVIPLGAGQAATFGVGNKARMLDRAASEGLPVPDSVIVLDAFWQLTTRNNVLAVEDEQVTCPDADLLMTALNLPSYPAKSKIAVRSAFSIEDQTGSSMAGAFHSVTDVDPTKPQAIADALCAVYQSSLAYDDIRRDVMIMQMVDAKHAGVAFTEADYEDDRVNYVEGTAEALLSGEESGESATLARLRPYERGAREEGPARADATWEDRLQVLLRRVRSTFGEGSWDVEWADDGTTCYLLQVRPIAAKTQRNEAFTLANHKEILPELPSVYMTSVIAASAPQLYNWYRQFDPSLPQHRPFIEVFKGRPYINLSLLIETMRALGLPTTLVTDSIGGDEGDKQGFNLMRAVAKLPTLAQLGMSQLNAVKSAEQTGERIKERTQQPGDTFSELNKTMLWVYSTLVTEMFNLTQAQSLPTSMLRRDGKLNELAAKTRTISTQMYDDLLPLRDYAKQNPAVMQKLEAGDMPDDPEFKRLWGLYLAKFGHRGIYESDIARPRYREDATPLLKAIASTDSIAKPHATQSEGLGPVASQAQKTIIAREQLRHSAMRAFDRIRGRLLELGTEAAERGALPAADAIWDMTLEELALLDVGWQPEASFFAERKAEIEALAAYDMPDLLHRFDDLENYNANIDPDIKRLSGMTLVPGQVSGKAWVLREPSATLPEGFSPDETILVARSVDAGWIASFTMAKAVIVETGGDLSHGSIVLRELGIPSVTNVKNATRVIQTGDAITLDGSTVSKG